MSPAAAPTVKAAFSPLLKATLALALACGVTLFAVTRPLTAPATHTVEIADMTWIEVRDAIARGHDTALVPSGGIEANGPHMITAKHQHIVAAAARMIAEKHGRMLVAPVIAHVPEGDFEPPTGNMTRPGTIGVTEATFEGILDGAARSLKAAGFRRIVFIADHGGSQAPQARVAARLDAEWRGQGVRVQALDAYYDEGGKAQQAFLTSQGESDVTIGDHAGLMDTAELLATHPAGVRLERLSRLLPALESDGSSGAPRRATPEMGQELLRLKVEAAVKQLAAPTS